MMIQLRTRSSLYVHQGLDELKDILHLCIRRSSFQFRKAIALLAKKDPEKRVPVTHPVARWCFFYKVVSYDGQFLSNT